MLMQRVAVKPGRGQARRRQAPSRSGYRVLIYSHDSFGLGHLRRCRTIAHSLVEHHKKLNVLLLTGSPIIGRYSFRSRVDFVRVPGIIKLRSGEYTSLSLHIDIEDTLALRASIIEHTARVFDPHLFLVDKEPLGLLGEVRRTLALLKRRRHCRLVLGLRDIMDEPGLLAEEWKRKGVMPALEKYYDDIWVYGLREFYDPVTAYRFPPRVAAKTVFTGYLKRELRPEVPVPHEITAILKERPHILVTPGGGGDGADLVDVVLSAYEQFDARLPWPALVVYGPFLPVRQREAFERRAARLGRVTTLTFHEHLENLMEEAVGVVCLGGYNTFCEVLSLNKRSIIVPRVTPRAEQLLRADSARKLGLVEVISPLELTPERLAEALSHLPEQPLPLSRRMPGLLDGLRKINAMVAQHQRDEVGRRPSAEDDWKGQHGASAIGPRPGR
jgi:predicted glycosyltransferase